MTRAPSYLDDNTRTFARTCPGFGKTAAQLAVAFEVYKTPMHKRALWAFCRHGWLIGPAVLAVLVFSGCTSDVDTYAAGSPVSDGGRGLKQFDADLVLPPWAGFARQRWRAWIETRMTYTGAPGTNWFARQRWRAWIETHDGRQSAMMS